MAPTGHSEVEISDRHTKRVLPWIQAMGDGQACPDECALSRMRHRCAAVLLMQGESLRNAGAG
jgi:hypothetical protein